MTRLRTFLYIITLLVVLLFDHTIFPALLGGTHVSLLMIILPFMVFYFPRKTFAWGIVVIAFFESLYSPYPFAVEALAICIYGVVLFLARKVVASESSVLPIMGFVALSPLCFLFLRELIDFTVLWLFEADELIFITQTELKSSLAIALANILLATILLACARLLRKRFDRHFFWKHQTL